MPTAFSYLRFSRPEQMKGDSQRRQLEYSRDWARQKKVPLDETLNLRDLGVSAFRGKNASEGALGLFLEAIATGRVKSGDYLILENLDRLSRDDVFDKALPLVQKIIGSGVNIVTLRTGRVFSRESVREIGALMEMLLELWLANEESVKKSQRLQHAWKVKRSKAKEETLTALAPKWLRRSEDKSHFEPIPNRVRVVRRIFNLAAEGRGAIAIAKSLNADGVPTFGDGKRKAKFWQVSYIKKILANRAVLGEYQPHRMGDGKRRPIGEPVPGYFPAVIDEATFYKAHQGKAERKGRGGRLGERVSNLFSGLLKDARDGSGLVMIDKGNGPALVSNAARTGAGYYISFPYPAFERALIVWGHDLKLADVLPRKATNIEGELAKAEARMADLTRRIKEIQKRLATDDNLSVLMDTVSDFAAQQQEARDTVERLKREQATPEAHAINDLKRLLSSLGRATTDERFGLRIKLRQLLRRLIEDIVVLVVQINKTRVAVADIRLRSGESRKVIIFAGGKPLVLPAGLNDLDVRHPSSWPKALRQPQFQVVDEEAQVVLAMESRGLTRTQIAAELRWSISRVSRLLVRNGKRKSNKKRADDKQQMTWHPAGNGWAKTYKKRRYFVGLGTLASKYPRLVKQQTRDGSMEAANRWWRAQLVSLGGGQEL